MTMQTIYFKEQQGSVHNSIGTKMSSSVQSSVPWWSSIGPQSAAYGAEPYGQLKSMSSMEHPARGNQLITSTKHQQGHHGNATQQGMDKWDSAQFTIFSGNCKNIGDGQKPQQLQAAISMQSAPPEYRARLELGFGQPMICGKYPYVDQCYGLFSAYGTQGRIMLPLNLTTDDGPIYVNAKQYHGIMRRRQSRAKAEQENKLTRARKPYMHESRHLHAMRRPRGCGGRFLTKKNKKIEKSGTEMKNGGGKRSQSAGSQSSEVFQSESASLSSPKEANGGGSTLSGSEVTSMYSREDLENFAINHLRSSVHSLSPMIDSGRGIVMPGKWVAAADNCCNLGI